MNFPVVPPYRPGRFDRLFGNCLLRSGNIVRNGFHRRRIRVPCRLDIDPHTPFDSAKFPVFQLIVRLESFDDVGISALFHLLAFCNNSGPAFILGVVGAGVFASSRVGVLLYLAHAAASICIGILFRFYKAGPTARREERQSRPQFHAQRFTTAFTGSIKNSFLSTLNICAFVVFFTVVIQLLIRSGFLPGLAQVLGTVLAPFGLTPEWAQRLLTGALEISSGVWTLSGDGTLSGKLILAAFMLGWAGISVHCQVLSFIGGSGLSVGTYLVGKLLHGGLSALFIAVLVRLFPLEAPVSDYLADQVAGIAGMDFHRTLVISLVCAWVLFLFFLFVAAAAARKSLGKRHRSVL